MFDQLSPIRTCGHAKIVGGTIAERSEFPYQVSLTYNDEFLCGGSILNAFLILTAAHCLTYKQPNRLKITGGAHYRSFGTGPEQISTARYIYMHENYVPETHINDIAIIVLGSSLQYTPHVQNISLPRKNEEFDGDTIVTGWGTTQENGYAVNILRKVSLPLVSNEDCSRRYMRIRTRVTDSMLCAGEAGRDACQGDSGGPAVCKRNPLFASRSAVLCGVVSFGNGCGREGFPGIFTKVSNYIDWIEDAQRKIVSALMPGVTTPAPVPTHCSADQFFCSPDHRCIPSRWRCDGDQDCRSGADEIGCSSDDNESDIMMTMFGITTTVRPTISSSAATTTTQSPWHSILFPGMSSQTTTVTGSTSIIGNTNAVCSREQFLCDNGNCISNEYQCDFDNDCGDGSDERNCHLIQSKPTCSAYFFQCVNGQCIDNRFQCDGDFDCTDKSDELNCRETGSEGNYIVNSGSTSIGEGGGVQMLGQITNHHSRYSDVVYHDDDMSLMG